MAELVRVLKPDGALITNYTNWFSYYLPVGILVNIRRRSVREDVYTKWFSLPEIRRLHDEMGFQIETVTGALQIPNRFKNPTLLRCLKWIDRGSRESVFRILAPQLFVKARKSLS